MRLVGATRWFIRWPFMIEGVVVGFAGGLVAILILWLGKITIVDPLSDTFSFLAAQNTAPLLPGSGRDPLRRRGAGLGDRLRHHPAALPQGLRPGEGRADRWPSAVALVAVLCVGIWLGGHPPSCPNSSATRFVDDSAGLTAEAAELIEDNYYRPVGSRRAGQLLPAGHGPRAAPTPQRPLLRLLLAGSARPLQRGDRGPLLGGRALRLRRSNGACGSTASSPARRRSEAGIGGRRPDRLGRRRLDRRGRAAEVTTEKIKGPEGTEVTIGVRERARAARCAQLRLTRAADLAAHRQQQSRDGRRPQARLRAPGHLQRRRPRALAPGGGEGAAPGGGGDRARPARQRRRPARGGGADRQHLPARGRGRRHHRFAHPGPHRLQDRRRQPAGRPDRRPDRPQHRLGGGDPHRRAGRQRRRRGGRHPLLRQGRLPAGDRPLQRRRPEADDRRVLHAGRGQPRQEPRNPSRRAGARRSAAPRPTRLSNGPWACWPPKNEQARLALLPASASAAADGAGSRPSRGTPARRSTCCCAERLGRRGFPASLEVEAGRAADAAESRSGRRRDLTELPTFTVDPATARDFDDAVSARREEDGIRLWIHIADVAAHVRPGSPLDLEARRRANSTYVPGAVEPMLPRALSEEACSLAPGRRAAGGNGRDRAGAEWEAARGELLPQPDPFATPASTTTSST